MGLGGPGWRQALADAAHLVGLHAELPDRLLQTQVYANFGIAFLQHVIEGL
jgi:hypothetical protein